MRKLKVAQIGIGHDHAPMILESMLRQNDIFEVKGFCVCEGEEGQFESKKNGVYSTSSRLTLEEILNDDNLDAVAVECNEVIATKYTHMALEKGLHVHMDKPGGIDHDDFTKMMQLAKEKKLIVHTGYMYRYNPAVIHAMEMVKSGQLGKIYSVEAHMDCLHNASKRQWLEIFPGGMFYFLGCHLLDLILQIQGLPQEIIPLNTCTGIDGVTSQDYGMVVLKYPDGISFAKTCAAEPGGFIRRQLVICGEKGTIEIKPFEKYVTPIEKAKDQVTGIREVYIEDARKVGWNYEASYHETEAINRYDNMMAAFAAMVKGEKDNPWSYEYETKLHKLLLEACGM